MAFASNIQAMNAARAMLKAQGIAAAALKEYFSIEKHDGEWHAMHIQAFPAPRDPLSCLILERDGAITFPLASDAPAIALTASQAECAAYDESGDEFYAQDEAEFDEAQANRQKAADALADSLQSASNLPNGKEWIRISSVEKPTKFVWHVADRMVGAALAAGLPAPSRKEVQDECIRLGVASGTARTQYQAWKKANDETALNAQRAAELSKRFNKA
jgi:hypothetical protein